jgi:high-affinity nickel-transport protein
VVSAIEALGLLHQQLDMQGSLWRSIDALNSQFGVIGFAICATFAALWAASALLSRRVP